MAWVTLPPNAAVDCEKCWQKETEYAPSTNVKHGSISLLVWALLLRSTISFLRLMYKSDFLVRYVKLRPLRSSSIVVFWSFLGPLNTKHGKTSFSVFALTPSNSLPDHLRLSVDLSSFNSDLKTYLFRHSLIGFFNILHLILSAYLFMLVSSLQLLVCLFFVWILTGCIAP